MLNIGTTGLIYVAVEPQDGRKGIDGLAGVVRTTLGRDPGSGDLFVFKNRRGDKLKILAWMGDGFALYLRRLEKGTFAFPTAATPELAVSFELASRKLADSNGDAKCFSVSGCGVVASGSIGGG